MSLTLDRNLHDIVVCTEAGRTVLRSFVLPQAQRVNIDYAKLELLVVARRVGEAVK